MTSSKVQAAVADCSTGEVQLVSLSVDELATLRDTQRAAAVAEATTAQTESLTAALEAIRRLEARLDTIEASKRRQGTRRRS